MLEQLVGFGSDLDHGPAAPAGVSDSAPAPTAMNGTRRHARCVHPTVIVKPRLVATAAHTGKIESLTAVVKSTDNKRPIEAMAA
jgi:hypothetical protein